MSTSTSTLKLWRRRSTPACAISSLTRTLGTGRGRLGGEEGGRPRDSPAGHRRAVAELCQRHLEPGERGQDVELVHVAHVADAHDPPAQAAVATRQDDAVAIAQHRVAL